MKRNDFIKILGLGSLLAGLSHQLISCNKKKHQAIRFGMIADVHQDIIPDGEKRLEDFLEAAKKRAVDFIIQMGDFCEVRAQNKNFIKIWKDCKIPKFNILGNHDMDRQSKESVMDFWEMPKPYYSFDMNGVHFIVLDANFMYQDGKFTPYNKANFYVDDRYRTFIDNEQIEWFAADLAATKLPTVVFSHQSLWHYLWGVKNRLTVQKIMEQHREKIICCFNGHNHIDYHHHQNGINYIEINSASYCWMKEQKYASKERLPKELYEQYGWMPQVAPYENALFAFATLPGDGSLFLEGKKSRWVAPSPYDMGMPKGIEGAVASADISDYKISF